MRIPSYKPTSYTQEMTNFHKYVGWAPCSVSYQVEIVEVTFIVEVAFKKSCIVKPHNAANEPLNTLGLSLAKLSKHIVRIGHIDCKLCMKDQVNVENRLFWIVIGGCYTIFASTVGKIYLRHCFWQSKSFSMLTNYATTEMLLLLV